MTPTQQELHEKNAQRFSQGEPFSSHTSRQGRLFQVFAQNTGLKGPFSTLTVIDRCKGTVNGYTRKEITRYHGFSPVSLLTDVPDDQLVRDIITDIRKCESEDDEDLLLSVAQAMIDAFNVVALSGL